MAKQQHFKSLWSILSGTVQPQSPDQIGPYIENSHRLLIEGIQTFKLRAQSNLGQQDSSSTGTFLSFLSQNIGLEEAQTKELLDVYRDHEFRGSPEQLNNLMKAHHLRPGLLAELWQFYHNERSYLIHCVEFLIQHAHHESSHRYVNIFQAFMETYNGQDQLKASLIRQLKQISGDAPPLAGTAPGQVKAWWAANWREKLLVLQCLIRYSTNRFNADDVVEILKVSIDRTDSPSDDPELEALHFSALRLHSVLLVKILNIRHSNERFGHFQHILGTIEEDLFRLSHRPEYSPVLLAWMLMHYNRTGNESIVGGSKAQQLGERAVGQRVLKIVADVASDPVIQGESSLRNLVCSALHDVVHVLIDTFDTERLSSPTDLRSATAALLRSGGSNVLDDFWLLPDHGLRLVWNECAAQFPIESVSLIQLAKAVAQSGSANKTKIVEELQRLPFYVEQLDAIPESIIKWTSGDAAVLLQTHYPYRAAGLKDVLIPRGSPGQVEGKTVRWQARVSLFDVAVGDFQLLLQQASFGLSAIKLDTLVRVQKMLGFLELVYPQLAAALPVQSQHIQQLIISLIERFGGLSSTTSELLAGCFLCLAASIDRSNAATVASKLLSLSSGVLPSLDRGLLKELKDENYLYYIKEARLSPGVVGTALAGIECTQGSYPLAGAFLKLITAFVQVELNDSRLMIPCCLFILREIFPYLLTWPYVSLEARDTLIDLCFNFLLRVLRAENPPKENGGAEQALKKLCVRALLDSDADCLMTVASYGPSLTEMQLLKQTNWEDPTGHGLVLIRQIRTALAVLNLLLNPAEPDDRTKFITAGGSPVLSQLETLLSAQRFITVLASYIFHRFEPLLVTLSLKILRSCASRWTNVSLLACLGQDAPFTRDAWLSRLESPLEDISVIESILRLMTASVARQPGLMHMLVNGEDRCLKAVAHLLEVEQIEALRLVHQFWSQSCFPAVEFFRKRAGFWPQLCRPLLASDKAENANRAAFVFQMIAAEMYNTSGRADTELQAILDKLPSHLPAWSDLVLKDRLPTTNGDQCDQLQVLSGWSSFIVMSAHYGSSKEAGLRSRIRQDVLESLTQQVEAGKSADKLLDKLASLHWMLQLVEKNCEEDTIASIGRLLIAVADRDLTSFLPRFQVAVLTCAVATVRLAAKSGSPIPSGLFAQWIRPAALCSQSCLLQLPGLLLQAAAPTESSGQLCPSSRASCITALCLALLSELVPLVPQELPIIQETFTLQTLVSTVQFCLHHRIGWDVTEAALSVLLAVAGTEPGSAVLVALQLDQSLWLPLEPIYLVQPSVYRLGVQLCATMLVRQRHFFLDEALTFVGVHRNTLADALFKLGSSGVTRDELALCIDVMALLGQMSKFQQKWRLQHTASMQPVLQAASAAVYFAIAQLSRSKLSSITQIEGEDTSPALMEAQNQLLDFISQGLAMLNCYNPPLAALLTEDGIDVAKWDRHLSPSFGSPSLDQQHDASGQALSLPSLSFGTLNAAGSFCLRLLSKSDGQQQLSSDQRGRLNLVLEQSLSLLLSQALLYILDPRTSAQEKQLLKRELGAELGTFVESLRRQAQRGLRSPASGSAAAALQRQVSVLPAGDQGFLKLVGHIVQRIFK